MLTFSWKQYIRYRKSPISRKWWKGSSCFRMKPQQNTKHAQHWQSHHPLHQAVIMHMERECEFIGEIKPILIDHLQDYRPRRPNRHTGQSKLVFSWFIDILRLDKPLLAHIILRNKKCRLWRNIYKNININMGNSI